MFGRKLDVARREGEQFLARVAGHPADGGIDLDEPEVTVRDGDAVLGDEPQKGSPVQLQGQRLREAQLVLRRQRLASPTGTVDRCG